MFSEEHPVIGHIRGFEEIYGSPCLINDRPWWMKYLFRVRTRLEKWSKGEQPKIRTILPVNYEAEDERYCSPGTGS